MKTLVFILLSNLPQGGQVELLRLEHLTFAQCDQLQQAVWDIPFPDVYYDEFGGVPSVDAYCIPTHMLALQENQK